MRQALQYQRLAGRVLALHEEDPSLSGSGVMHEGDGLGAARAGRHPVGLGVDAWSRATASSPATRTARIHVQHVSARETVEVIERAKAAGVQVTAEATPHHLLLTDEARPLARHALQDEPAAALRGRPPGADRGPALRARSTASRPTTRRTRARRRSSRSSSRRWASPGSRPRSRRSTPTSCCRACSPLGADRRADDRGRRAVRARRRRRSRRARRRTSASSTSRRSGRWARPATRAARRTAPSPAAG